MKVAIIIPARFSSTRLPEKALADLGGKPLICWVYDACKKVSNADQVIVATDHQRIKDAVEQRNGAAIMTSDAHRSGTDRCAEVGGSLDVDLVLNVQGDEPFINPEYLEQLIEYMKSDPSIQIATLFHELKSETDLKDPSKVKLTKTKSKRILYFSRSVIPFQRNQSKITYFKHIGIYGFRKSALMDITKLEPTMLEETESLEQLRWLENDFEIYGMEVPDASLGIDTPEDLEKARILLENRD